MQDSETPKLIHQGKVRDIYDLGDALRLVATDRLSGFDRALANIPHKAQVLNQLSAWWFEQTKHLIDNHVIAVDGPTSTRVKRCTVFPIEVVVRGYITGTTNTAMWTLYQQGERQFFATELPDGLHKNQALVKPILTPTTKEADHDRPLSVEMIQSGDWIDPIDWKIISHKALALFEFAQQRVKDRGLILVDTKFEFGRDDTGNILLIDECLTPDSSRYWCAETYEERVADGLEPKNFDKELIRLWYREHCDPYHDTVLPEAPTKLIQTMSHRYIQIFEMITGQQFQPAKEY